VVVALWTLAGFAPGAMGFLIFRQWGPLATAAFWVLASRITREPQAKGIAGWLLPLALVPAMHLYHPAWTFLVAQTLPRAAAAGLAWIARPAAKAELPNVTSAGAILALVIGLVPAVLAGSHSLLLIVAVALIIRIVQAFSYRQYEGITSSSMGWTRQLAEIAVLAISPPESFL
jgi:hypothetical protein